jgi:hypothetical protein
MYYVCHRHKYCYIAIDSTEAREKNNDNHGSDSDIIW